MHRKVSRLVIGLAVVISLPAISIPAPALGQSLLEEGMSSYRAGDYEGALQRFQQAAEEAPDDAAAWTWLGATYLQLNRFQEAAGSLRRAVQLDPGSAGAHVFLGVAYLRLGDLAQARAAFQQVLTLAPGSEYARSAAAWLQSMGAGGTPPGPGAAQCPTPPVTTVKRPDVAQVSGAVLEIVSLEFEVSGTDLVINGEVANNSERTLRSVRLDVTGYQLDGRALAPAVLVLRNELEAGDLQEFSIRLGLKPPPIWVRLRVTDYGGRPSSESLPSMLASVPVGLYEPLAIAQIKVNAGAVPNGPARSHTICVWIADSVGFPVGGAGVRVVLDGYSTSQAIRQDRMVEVTSVVATSFVVQWPVPVRPIAQVTVESVRLTEPP